jgi:hypothetical protein
MANGYESISAVQPDASAQNRLRSETGERVAILIDLPDPRGVKDFAFLQDKSLTIQRLAHDVFYVRD